MNNVLDELVSDREISSTTRKILALILLYAAAAIALFGRFEGTILYFIPTTYSITPNLISGALGLALILPLYWRGILTWRFGFYSLISSLVLLFVFSALVQIVIGTGIGTGVKTLLLGAAILLSWVGMRGVASISWILLLAAVVISLQGVAEAMGIWGWVFLALSFFGLVLHSRLSPAQLVESLRNEYGQNAREIRSEIQSKAEIHNITHQGSAIEHTQTSPSQQSERAMPLLNLPKSPNLTAKDDHHQEKAEKLPTAPPPEN